MFEVGVVVHFEAAHALRGNFGPAVRRHGHTYRVEAAASGQSLKADGTLCDIGLLQEALHGVVDPLHYCDLDELPQFSGKNTTAETVARHIFDGVAPRLRSEPVEQLTVRVWESPQAYASYSGGVPREAQEVRVP